MLFYKYLFDKYLGAATLNETNRRNRKSKKLVVSANFHVAAPIHLSEKIFETMS